MPGRPAARSNDAHVCPQPLPVPPGGLHVGGVIQAAGAANVFINKIPAAVVGDTCICPEPGNTIKDGSSSVRIGGKAAARQLDGTTHNAGGMIQSGSPNVYIGD